MTIEIMEFSKLTKAAEQSPTDNENLDCTKAIVPRPKDNFFTVHILFLFLGIMHLLPVSFFYTANDYWMHKFRDPTLHGNEVQNRSVLQSQFTSSCMVAQNIPQVICLVIACLFGYKVKVKFRIYSTLAVLVLGFITCTIFINVNTDYWQNGFFAFTMILLGVTNGTLAILQVSSLALLSKFPNSYMKIFLIGEGVGGVFTCSLQILSLALGTDSESSAVIYFVLGTMITSFTLLLFYISQKTKVYKFYMKLHPEDTQRSVIKWKEILSLSRKIWTSLAIACACALAYIPTHPSIAALVVSENYNKGYVWNDIYFVAVITFWYSEIGSLIGRVISTVFKKLPPMEWLVFVAVLRVVIFPPLFMFCNALPRHHLPVLFPHDWQYIIILTAFMVTSGYLFNVAFLYIERLKSKELEENALVLIQTSVGLVSAVFSPISVLCVYLL